MKLEEFISALEKMRKEHGSEEVVMADGLPVVRTVFSDEYSSRGSVVITDEK